MNTNNNDELMTGLLTNLKACAAMLETLAGPDDVTVTCTRELWNLVMKERHNLRHLLTAADNIAGWFRTHMDPRAMSFSEHLLAGCPNELMGDVEKLREVIVEAMKGTTP